MLISGKCHCGNIAFSLTGDPEPKEIPARTCDCTFCQKHGGVWTSNPRGLNRAPASFGAEETGSRLARRKRSWIPDVTFK